MSNHYDTVIDSVRSNGRDTIATKPTNFLNTEAISPPSPNSSEPKYEMWTEEHSAQSRARRENRENRTKPPPVAEVPDFNLETHLQEAEKERAKEKSKWKLW